MDGWLQEDKGVLSTLEGVKRAANDWAAHGCVSDWLNHSGTRLEDAEKAAAREDLAGDLSADAKNYLDKCREQEEAKRRERLARLEAERDEQERRVKDAEALAAADKRTARRTRIGLAASSALAVLAIAAALFGFGEANVAFNQTAIAERRGKDAEEQRKDAEEQTLIAEQRSAMLAAKVSRSYTEAGAIDQALLLMLDGARLFDDTSAPDEIRIALDKALRERERLETRAHDLGDVPKKALFTTSLDGVIGKDTPIQTLHRGTCVGFAIPRAKSAIMPDGREIVFDTSSVTESSDKHELHVSGSRSLIIALGEDANCIQFSSDWTRMLTVKENGVTVYDFQKVLETGTLVGNEIGAIPIANAASAFFVGSDEIVTANYTNRVQLWGQIISSEKTWTKETEIYSGDNVIIYAEPDDAAQRLILLEDIGQGNVHGLLYSVSTHDVWFDLGTDYKWLGAAFTDKSEVAVSEHGSWIRGFAIPPLSALVALGDKELSPECRPPSRNEYKNSSCWPPSLEPLMRQLSRIRFKQ